MLHEYVIYFTLPFDILYLMVDMMLLMTLKQCYWDLKKMNAWLVVIMGCILLL